jgi:hypothetical protein
MCAGAAASGARTWLQTHHMSWLTPSRLRAATITLLVSAGLFCSLGISGASPAAAHHAPAPAVAPR